MKKRTRYSEKATEAFVECYSQLKEFLGPNDLRDLAKVFFECGKTYWSETFWHPEFGSRGRLLRIIGDLDLARSVAKNDHEPITRLNALKYLIAQTVVDSNDWQLAQQTTTTDKDPSQKVHDPRHVAKGFRWLACGRDIGLTL